MKIVVPGIAGRLAQLLARRLREQGHDVIGMDARPCEHINGVELYNVDIRKRAAEDVFRQVRPQAIVHMATVSALTATRDDERHRINLGGTRATFELAKAWGVEHVIFVGRHTFYGAASDLPLYHREEEPPQGLESYPELSDLVASDLFAATQIWRVPGMATTVLRLCYVLGPSGTGTLATFLRGRVVPMIAGFDPLFQFLHDEDAVSAIAKTIEKRPRGIFNVAGPQPLPLGTVARLAGRRTLPLPEPLLAFALGRGGLPNLPPGALTHIKFPIVVDASAFRAATGFAHKHDELETVRAFARKFPVGKR